MKIVHCKKEPHDVYIGRPSKWGNPFVIGKDGTRKEVIQKYRDWIVKQPELMNSLGELSGKVLGCWCEGLPCHGDVLVELVKNRRLKLAVIGSRTFNDRGLLFATLDKFLDRIDLIISGGAIGADSLAEDYAKANGLPILIHYPKWIDKNGKKNMRAGFDRNKLIVDSCNAVLAFHDGVSKGTLDSISYAKSKNVPVKVVKF